MEIALEPKPNEPRGNMLLPTVGHALAFIHELEFPEMVGLNPEFAHETMSGLSFHHAVAQVLWADKLFHIDLNGQVPGKYDQDFRFGSEGVKDAFYLVKLLEDAEWDGMRHFDAHAYRTEDADGVWDFAAGCMRTYLMLKEKAERFAEDAEIQDALATAKVDQLSLPTLPEDGEDRFARLRKETVDVDALGRDRLGPRTARPARHGAPPRASRVSLHGACIVGRRLLDAVHEGRGARRGLRSARRPRLGAASGDVAAALRAGPGDVVVARSITARAEAGHDAAIAGMSVAAQQHGLVVLDEPGRGDPAGEALERHRVRAGRGLAARSARRRRRGVGRRVRIGPGRGVHDHEALVAAPQGARGVRPDRARACSRTTGSSWRLTGELGTDRGDASGTGYWSAATGEYRLDLLEIVDADTDWAAALPPVLGPDAATGTGDNMAAALGLGLRPGDVAISLGTSGTVFAVSDTPTADPTGAVCGFADATGRYLPARLHAERDQGHRRDRAPARRRPAAARRDGARGPAGSGGVVFVPYLDGERTPNRPNAIRDDLRAALRRRARAARPQRVRRRRLRAARRRSTRCAPRASRPTTAACSSSAAAPAAPRTVRSSPTSRSDRSS